MPTTAAAAIPFWSRKKAASATKALLCAQWLDHPAASHDDINNTTDNNNYNNNNNSNKL